MGNPNCCFMIIAVAFFSPANRRGELWVDGIEDEFIIYCVNGSETNTTVYYSLQAIFRARNGFAY